MKLLNIWFAEMRDVIFGNKRETEFQRLTSSLNKAQTSVFNVSCEDLKWKRQIIVKQAILMQISRSISRTELAKETSQHIQISPGNMLYDDHSKQSGDKCPLYSQQPIAKVLRMKKYLLFYIADKITAHLWTLGPVP